MAGEIAKWFVSLGVQGSDKVKTELASVKGGLLDLTGAVSTLKTGLGALGIYMAARTAYDLAEAGAKALELRDAFREVARQAGSSGEEILTALRRASGGTISETDLMLAANKAMLLGLGADAQQLASLMEIARFRARAMGLDTTQAFSDIVTGLGRMSPLILDNLGLVFDAETEFTRYAESIGKTAKELTEAEKKQALLQATLRVGSEQIREAGGIARSAADDFREVAAATEDLKVALQEMLAETGLVKFLADAARWMADNQREARRATATYQEFIGEVERLGAAGHLTAKEVQAFKDQAGKLQYELGMGYITQMAYAASWEELRQRLRETAIALGDVGDAIQKEQTYLDAMVPHLERAAEAQSKLTQGMLAHGVLVTALSSQEPKSPFWARFWNLQWEQQREEARKAAEETKRVWQETLSTVEASLRGILRPTITFDYASIMDQLGHHIETWDEEARRAMDVVARGMESPWSQRMLELGMITPEDIAAFGGDIRAAAATWVKEFYEGMHPEAIKGESIAKLWKDEMTSEANWRGIFGELSNVLGKQLEADRAKMEAAGVAAGQAVVKGVKMALKEGDLLNYLIDQIIPRLPTTNMSSMRGGYIE